MDRRLSRGVALAAAGVFVAQCAVRRQETTGPPSTSERPSAAAPAAPAAGPSVAVSGASAAAPPPPAAGREAPAPLAFEDTVAPILARRCSPCHVPGGKMYGKMPFDSPAVVRSHEEGILRRIKEPQDRDPLIAWLRSSSR